MADVLEMQALPTASPMPPQRSLRLLSRWLAVLFTIFAALQILWVVAAWAATLFFSDHMVATATGFSIFTGKPPVIPGGVLYAAQPLLTRGAGMIIIAMTTAPILMMFWELRGLFRLYARGIVFARDNAVYLKHTGFCLVAYPVAQIAGNLVFRLAGGLDKAWFHIEFVYALVLGLIVTVIAQVMEFGGEIEQEKDSFI
jgi:Protein of unknown function (DUF2975)